MQTFWCGLLVVPASQDDTGRRNCLGTTLDNCDRAGHLFVLLLDKRDKCRTVNMYITDLRDEDIEISVKVSELLQMFSSMENINDTNLQRTFDFLSQIADHN